jgi:hypothetical protein
LEAHRRAPGKREDQEPIAEIEVRPEFPACVRYLVFCLSFDIRYSLFVSQLQKSGDEGFWLLAA